MAYVIPDHPDIRRAEATGYVHGKYVEPVCPVCGMTCDTIYRTHLEIVGCDECVSSRDAWEVPECFPERN